MSGTISTFFVINTDYPSDVLIRSSDDVQPAYRNVIDMNATWHLNHVMPKRPSIDQRIRWHTAHAKHCACRPIPPALMKEIDARRNLSTKGKLAQRPPHRSR